MNDEESSRKKEEGAQTRRDSTGLSRTQQDSTRLNTIVSPGGWQAGSSQRIS